MSNYVPITEIANKDIAPINQNYDKSIRIKPHKKDEGLGAAVSLAQHLEQQNDEDNKAKMLDSYQEKEN